jgi:hypothetical protein
VAGNETKGQLPQEKFAEQLDELDEGLVNLHVLYEKYFLGIDRKPPEQERKKISGRIRELRNMMIKNTGLKFRLNNMVAKLISHERLWDRTLREIEDGTYKRDVFKAKIRQQQGEGGGKPKQPERIELSDDKLRRLYDTWMVARQRTGESVAGMNYDAVAQKIRSQVPGLIQKHGAKSIEFKVVIKGGKAILKAIPHT